MAESYFDDYEMSRMTSYKPEYKGAANYAIFFYCSKMKVHLEFAPKTRGKIG
jgi:hypothetical protein